jgi:hypothetical protein
MSSFNRFTNLPYVPYQIIKYLATHNEKIFKILYYNDINALGKPDLSLEDKLDMIYVDDGKETDRNIFFKPLIGEEMTDATSQLRIYKYTISPTDSMTSVITYRFDILVGSKTSLVYDNKIPCTRTDIIETELLNTLNGVDLFGTGKFQFNRDLTTMDKQLLTLSNSKQFFGSYLTMSVRWLDVNGEECG